MAKSFILLGIFGGLSAALLVTIVSMMAGNPQLGAAILRDPIGWLKYVFIIGFLAGGCLALWLQRRP